MKELSLDVGNTFLTNLETLVREHGGISQNRALQFIFDVKFLVLFIGGNSDTKDEVILTRRIIPFLIYLFPLVNYIGNFALQEPSKWGYFDDSSFIFQMLNFFIH